MNAISRPTADVTPDPGTTSARLLTKRRSADLARERVNRDKAVLAAAKDPAARAKAKKALRRSSVHLSQMERDVKAEVDAEAAAPEVRRQEISHQGVVLREPMVEMRGKRAELTPGLERLRAKGAVTQAEFRALRRYRDAWEKAGQDAFPIGLGGDGGRSAPASGNRRVEEAVARSADLDAARRCVGAAGAALLEHIVILGLSVASYASKRAESEHVTKGRLLGCAELLVEFWSRRDGVSDFALAKSAG